MRLVAAGLNKDLRIEKAREGPVMATKRAKSKEKLKVAKTSSKVKGFTM